MSRKGDLIKRENGIWLMIYSSIGSGIIKEAYLSKDSACSLANEKRKFLPNVNFRLLDGLAILEPASVDSQIATPISEGKTLGNTKQSTDNIGRQAPPPSKHNLSIIDKAPFSTGEELTMKHLVSAYEEFSNLEQTNPNDIKDFVFHINALQRILGQRVLRRDYPNIFPTHK
jgi:hypothetical protein